MTVLPLSRILCTSLFLLPGLPAAAAEPVVFSEDPADLAVAQVRALLAEDLEQAEAIIGREQIVQAALVDVDADGVAEILGQGYGVYFCGNAGCQTFLYRFQGDTWRLLLSVNTHEVALADTATNGLRDLILNGDRLWAFDGAAYHYHSTLGDSD